MKKTTGKIRSKNAQKVIGMVTTYFGNERLHVDYGTKVLITAVFKRKFDKRLVPDHDPEFNYIYVTDNDELQRLGGLDLADIVEVRFWHPTENRWCPVCDKVGDLRVLEAFKNLR
jgi:hypothetical protein